MPPKLKWTSGVAFQERHKTNLKETIDLILSRQRINDLEKEGWITIYTASEQNR
jgi:hypothetical protein